MNILTLLMWLVFCPLQEGDEVAQADSILQKVEYNLWPRSQVKDTQMVIYGRQRCRTITSRAYSQGHEKTFTEYLDPEGERDLKILRLQAHLWVNPPATDSTAELSGDLLGQPVMGSDMSFQDMMEESMLLEGFDGTVIGQEIILGRKTWVLELVPKTGMGTYGKRKAWVDQEWYVPIREELFAPSGQLLKCVTRSGIQQVEGRWVPSKVTYRDVLKDGEGTDLIVTAIKFDVEIPEGIFSKEALGK